MLDITRENIWNNGEYNYEAAYGFIPNLHFYLHEEDKGTDQEPKGRPFMLVVPGGGYCMVVPPEAEIVAKVFYEQGMNCAVLTYTTDITMSIPLKKQPLADISRAVRYIRKHAARLSSDPKRIAICGFSAGGHVCGSLAVHFDDEEIKDPDPSYEDISNRPDAVILGYPVITSGEFTHIYSMWALVGKDGPKEEYEYFSLEKHVTEKTPPTFLWQTATDDLVPIENSALFAQSCRAANVNFAYYVFPYGPHGLSVCNEDFRKGNFGEEYTMEQLRRAVEAVREGRGVGVPEDRQRELIAQFDMPPPTFPPAPEYKDVVLWPELVRTWLSRIW